QSPCRSPRGSRPGDDDSRSKPIQYVVRDAGGKGLPFPLVGEGGSQGQMGVLPEVKSEGGRPQYPPTRRFAARSPARGEGGYSAGVSVLGSNRWKAQATSITSGGNSAASNSHTVMPNAANE